MQGWFVFLTAFLAAKAAALLHRRTLLLKDLSSSHSGLMQVLWLAEFGPQLPSDTTLAPSCRGQGRRSSPSTSFAAAGFPRQVFPPLCITSLPPPLMQVLGLTQYSHWPEATQVRRCIQRWPQLQAQASQMARKRLHTFLHVGLTEQLELSILTLAVSR